MPSPKKARNSCLVPLGILTLCFAVSANLSKVPVVSSPCVLGLCAPDSAPDSAPPQDASRICPRPGDPAGGGTAGAVGGGGGDVGSVEMLGGRSLGVCRIVQCTFKKPGVNGVMSHMMSYVNAAKVESGDVQLALCLHFKLFSRAPAEPSGKSSLPAQHRPLNLNNKQMPFQVAGSSL